MTKRQLLARGGALQDAVVSQPCRDLHQTKRQLVRLPLQMLTLARRRYFATWRSRNSSNVLQSMHSVAVGRASKRFNPISTPQLSQ